MNFPQETVLVKCKKCSRILLEGRTQLVVDAHGNPISSEKTPYFLPDFCETVNKRDFFLAEKHWPGWVQDEIVKAEWKTGMLKCSCRSIVGDFDFISKKRCGCKRNVLPSVKLNFSKVNYLIVPFYDVREVM